MTLTCKYITAFKAASDMSNKNLSPLVDKVNKFRSKKKKTKKKQTSLVVKKKFAYV